MKREDKNQLRIGNLLMLNGKVEIVSSIHSDGTVRFYNEDKDSCHGCYGLNLCEPIKINEEWAINFGFENIVEMACFFRSESRFSIGIESIHLNSIKVHEAQNLFYLLTGEELTLQND